MAHSFILSLSLRSKQHFYSFCSPSAFTYTTYYVKTARMKAFKNVPWLLLLQLITTSSKLVGGRIPSDSSSYVTLSQSWIDEELREYLKHPLSFPPTSGPVSQKPELATAPGSRYLLNFFFLLLIPEQPSLLSLINISSKIHHNKQDSYSHVQFILVSKECFIHWLCVILFRMFLLFISQPQLHQLLLTFPKRNPTPFCLFLFSSHLSKQGNKQETESAHNIKRIYSLEKVHSNRNLDW
ncbi:hypothetical protein VP01_510g8 [Puccinia sorghi]|uniref:Uncharacterized protein n=1 Tax=Puccinia sorghi TaxID=27349 RepID=A0A0L6UL54_9BASI|nr:hypothetical protein VP01_510g8 [Puccinia sorghi]